MSFIQRSNWLKFEKYGYDSYHEGIITSGVSSLGTSNRISPVCVCVCVVD